MRFALRRGSVVLLARLCASASAIQPGSAAPRVLDTTPILDGVTEIAAPGVPGSIVVYGDGAVPLIAGKVGKSLLQPVAAAAILGKGRIVALGHSGYGGRDSAQVADTGEFITNAIHWVADDYAGSRQTRVAVVGGDLAAYLNEHNLVAEAVKVADLAPALARVRVVVLSTTDLTDEHIAALRSFVELGGGLVVAQTGWGWQQLNGGKDMALNPINRLLASTGLVYTDGTVTRTGEKGFDTPRAPPEECHAGRAIDALIAQSDGRIAITDAAMAQIGETATLAVRSIPADDTLLRPRLRALLESPAGRRFPTKSAPLKAKTDSLARVLLAMQIDELARLPAAQNREHPAAADFPGAPPADAPVVDRMIQIDTKVPGRHSLGLYARPGRVVTVDLSGKPEALAKAKLHIRIGAHSDSLWHADSWQRVPEITRVFPVPTPSTQATCAFGGLIYIEVPDNCTLGTIAATIRGGVESPLFILGQTAPDEWRETIRARPGPWAELAGRKIIVTVPTDTIRALDDPTGVLEFWDRVADGDADLAAIPHERKRPERYVADVQISAGYMHSGYPIMTHLDAAPAMVSLDKMKAGQWGLFHELGHNHQDGMWTFTGTGEVTCNLFSMYIIEEVCGLPKEKGHGAVADREQRIRKYFEQPASYERWSADPFTALVMYSQIRDAFGWEAYKKVFAEYRALPAAERPKTDDQKRDQWLVRLSRTVGHNLGPFFAAWGVPTSEQARESIMDLPGWMPPDMPGGN